MSSIELSSLKDGFSTFHKVNRDILEKLTEFEFIVQVLITNVNHKLN